MVLCGVAIRYLFRETFTKVAVVQMMLCVSWLAELSVQRWVEWKCGACWVCCFSFIVIQEKDERMTVMQSTCKDATHIQTCSYSSFYHHQMLSLSC